MIEFTRNKLELLCDSKIVALYKDYLTTPDGNTVVYDYIKHKNGGGAGVLLVDDNEYTYLVRQFRNSINAPSIEIPAGGYSYAGEAGDVCAKREAEEETGYIPGNLYHVTNMVSSIGTFDERTDVYIGWDLKKGNKHFDPDEYIDLLHLPIEEAIDMVYKGEIVDSKTMVALFSYKDLKSKGIFK